MARVAFFLSGLAGGGAQRRFVTLANAFAARGFSVDLVPARAHGPFRSCLGPEVRVVPLESGFARLAAAVGRKKLWVLGSIPALASYLRRERPDLLLSTSNPANTAALLARRVAGERLPVIISVNVPPGIALRPWRRTLLRLLVPRVYPEADLVLANAAAVAEDLLRLVPALGGRVRILPNPIDVDHIRERAREETSHPWLARPDPAVILAVGKLKPQKDHPTLLRAFALLRRPARLLVLGEGPLRRRLEKLARRLGIAPRVCFAGFVENPYAYMARAAVLASTSRWEGFSNVVAEALACGCPVVATDCPGGTRDLLGGGRWGRLVPVGDPPALAAALEEVLARPPERQALQARAEAFRCDRVVPLYAAAVSELIARSRATEGQRR